MIKTNELKHNGYFNHNGLIVQISGFRTYSTDKPLVRFENTGGEYGIDTLQPIPLTEEWLLKAGFTSDDYKKGYIGIDVHNENGMSTDFVLSYPGRMGEWQKYFVWEFNNYMFNKIEFVHELQNFYTAMTGYELVFSTEP